VASPENNGPLDLRKTNPDSSDHCSSKANINADLKTPEKFIDHQKLQRAV